ncbi:hypothetical protein [Mycobacteroides chelonae]|uniref:hypothetical protein n=1 Tax=Mycobacteroides chelonae TaxID=1774 RepID=UPI00099319ED|nr:hypothetical protein [Mycobacteroides chelonae]
MKKIPIPILSVMAAVAITVTACSVPPVIHDSGPSPSASCTQPPGAPPCPGGAGVWRPTTAETAVWAAKRFGAERIDAAAATAALESGRPFLVGLPNGGNPACHTALLVPGDPDVWILNRSAVSSAGHAMSRETLQYGCDSGTTLPNQSPNAMAPNQPLDQPAARAAMAAKVPYIYGLPSGPEPACHTAVMLPGEVRWVLNRSGGPTVAGDALDRTYTEYACTSRGGVR